MQAYSKRLFLAALLLLPAGCQTMPRDSSMMTPRTVPAREGTVYFGKTYQGRGLYLYFEDGTPAGSPVTLHADDLPETVTTVIANGHDADVFLNAKSFFFNRRKSSPSTPRGISFRGNR